MGPSDSEALEGFCCRSFREPWTEEIESLIRAELPEAIDLGLVEGAGLWDDDSLLGVVAWSANANALHTTVLAVAMGKHGRGYGHLLKDHLVATARQRGFAAVTSYVHWDNGPMLAINESYTGVSIKTIAGDRDHAMCVIPCR